MDRAKTIKVYGSGVLFACIVGFSFLGVKVGVAITTPLMTMTFRYNFAFLGAAVFYIFSKEKFDLRGREKKNIFFTAFFYVVFMILQAIGLVYATSVESGIIFAVIPVFTKILAGITLGERSGWKQNVFMCVSISALAAMIICGASSITLNLLGAVVLMLSSLSLAISNVIMRYVRGKYTPMEISAVIAFLGFVSFNIATIILSVRDGNLDSYIYLLGNVKFLIATAYLGIPSLLLSAWLMAYMTKNIEAVKATIFGNLSTAISIVTGVVILGEPLYIYHIVCTALVIIGVLGVSVTK